MINRASRFHLKVKICFHVLRFKALHKHLYFSLQVLFDHLGCIKKYDNVEEILREFYDLRLEFYKKRKAYMVGMLEAEALKLDNIARFILEKIEGTITIGWYL